MSEGRVELKPVNERPLVTFALITFNQEKFIRESVQGAFNQAYEPLEIIISDDCSTDRTFEIVQEMVRAYDGPHKIRLNRNANNMGISSHVRYIHEVSQGDIVIHAAGDDISGPDRTSKIVDAFGSSNAGISMVMSNGEKVDVAGIPSGPICPDMNDAIVDRPKHPREAVLPFIGCTMAISSHLIDDFPAPQKGIVAEDVVLMRRAYLMNGVKYIPDQLVKYRIHSGAITSHKDLSRIDYLRYNILWTRDRIAIAEQFIADLHHIQHPSEHHLSKNLVSEIRSEKIVLRVLEGALFPSMLALFQGLVSRHEPVYQRFRKDLLKHAIVRWAPFLLSYQ
ncbi:glycosyltransferase [Mariprofundus erugo]|uniref:glycosyltransferase n=1 Tax=Mariprofundus erugo TaxID=2528639 RepID=UPI0010FE04D6|nr:glycosyltransferase [Mariprofundus erugo]TLS78408.1 glycosyltransferase [Mariprofundus erugo]